MLDSKCPIWDPNVRFGIQMSKSESKSLNFVRLKVYVSRSRWQKVGRNVRFKCLQNVTLTVRSKCTILNVRFTLSTSKVGLVQNVEV
jgi:hypothetical protein